MKSQYKGLFMIVLMTIISTNLNAQFFTSELTSDNLIYETIFGGYEANYGLDSMVIASDFNTTTINSIEMKLNGLGSISMNNSGSISISNSSDLLGGQSYLRSENTSTSGVNSDGYAIHGLNDINDWFGYGVVGEGGFVGVDGFVGPSGSSNYYGVYGSVIGGSGTNYGVYGTSNGGDINYAGYFSGDVTVTGTFNNPSDLKLKRDIVNYDNAIEKLMSLETKAYHYKTKEFPTMILPETKQFGFIAQELQELFPELVKMNVHTTGDKSDEVIEYLGVNYLGLVPVLTRAIQEQQYELRAKDSEIEILKKQMAELESNFQEMKEIVSSLKE